MTCSTGRRWRGGNRHPAAANVVRLHTWCPLPPRLPTIHPLPEVGEGIDNELWWRSLIHVGNTRHQRQHQRQNTDVKKWAHSTIEFQWRWLYERDTAWSDRNSYLQQVGGWSEPLVCGKNDLKEKKQFVISLVYYNFWFAAAPGGQFVSFKFYILKQCWGQQWYSSRFSMDFGLN